MLVICTHKQAVFTMYTHTHGRLTIVSEVEGAACEEVDVCADSMSGDGDVLGSSSSPPAEQQHGSADQPLTTSQPTLTTTAAAVEATTLAAIEQVSV